MIKNQLVQTNFAVYLLLCNDHAKEGMGLIWTHLEWSSLNSCNANKMTWF